MSTDKPQPTETEREHAARIRAAVEQLHVAIDAACNAGISVSFGMKTWSKTGKPHIADLLIERRANWLIDFPGYTL